MSFSGSGGPPPKQAREQGLSGGNQPFGFRYYEDLANGKKKQIQFLSLEQDRDTKVGEKDAPIIILDEAPPGGDEWQPSVHIHERFKYRGSWENYSVCRCKTPEGCLLDVALQTIHKHAKFCKDDCDREGKPQKVRGKWRWVASGIKMVPYTIKGGKNKGKVIPFTRGLLLFGEDQYKELLAYRKAFKGLRGRVFHVSRSDGTFSPRVGDSWDPVDHWDDEKMMEQFKDAAADYGVPVEEYIKPFNYETILALPSVKAISETARWVAGERGIDLDAPLDGTTTAATAGNPVATAVAAASAVAAEEESAEDDVPF